MVDKGGMVTASSRDKEKKGKITLRSISVSKADNGGHIVEHHFESSGMNYYPEEKFVFGADEGKKLVDHLKQHLQIDNPHKNGGY